MNDLTRAVLAMSVLVFAGCGEGAGDEGPRAGQSPRAEQSDGAIEETAGALHDRDDDDDDASIPAGTPFKVRGCTYVVFEQERLLPPPIWQLFVERLASKGCPRASVLLDTSFKPTSPLVATKGGKTIVVGYTLKPTPSGAGLSHVEIDSLSPRSLATLRNTGVGSPSGSSSLAVLFFTGDDLVAEGHKPEGNYIATFPLFLTSTALPTLVITP